MLPPPVSAGLWEFDHGSATVSYGSLRKRGDSVGASACCSKAGSSMTLPVPKSWPYDWANAGDATTVSKPATQKLVHVTSPVIFLDFEFIRRVEELSSATQEK